MADNDATCREIADTPVETIIGRLFALGDLQIVTRAGGIVHEQFGDFPVLERTGDELACRGTGHYTVLSPKDVRRVVINRLGGTKTAPQPRVDFLDSDEQILVSVLGKPDSASFQAVLDGFTCRPSPDVPETKASEPVPVHRSHPSVAPLQAVANSGRAITIEFQRAGVRSSWSGVVQELQLGAHNINIMRPDFHLHLRGGAIDSWKRTERPDGYVEQHALDSHGRDLGLILRGDAHAFA